MAVYLNVTFGQGSFELGQISRFGGLPNTTAAGDVLSKFRAVGNEELSHFCTSFTDFIFVHLNLGDSFNELDDFSNFITPSRRAIVKRGFTLIIPSVDVGSGFNESLCRIGTTKEGCGVQWGSTVTAPRVRVRAFEE